MGSHGIRYRYQQEFPVRECLAQLRSEKDAGQYKCNLTQNQWWARRSAPNVNQLPDGGPLFLDGSEINATCPTPATAELQPKIDRDRNATKGADLFSILVRFNVRRRRRRK